MVEGFSQRLFHRYGTRRFHVSGLYRLSRERIEVFIRFQRGPGFDTSFT